MKMVTRSSMFTIAQYYAMWKKGELIVNRDYQRSDDVWPPSARSYFIETLLLGYPIPKLYLFQRTDIKTKLTKLEVVDGQQRTQSIVEFFDNAIKLGKRSYVAGAEGKTYNALPVELQQSFLDYGVPCDVFVSATQSEVREVFRRMNSHTVSLNAEEKRHADYQGVFKWFINELAKHEGDSLKAIGVLTEKQLVRMQDAKVFADVIHALTFGIQTTKPKDLDKLYEKFDQKFTAEDEIRDRITDAMSFVVQCKNIHNTSIMKSHVFYSLMLAITHAQKPAVKLNKIFPRTKRLTINRGIAEANLSVLAGALDKGEAKGKFRDFVLASESGGTNVKDKREGRLRWLSSALGPKAL